MKTKHEKDIIDLSIYDFLHKKLDPIISNTNEGDLHLYSLVIDSVEKSLIHLALEKTGGNQLKAAKILGINRGTLKKKISKLNICVKKRANRE